MPNVVTKATIRIGDPLLDHGVDQRKMPTYATEVHLRLRLMRLQRGEEAIIGMMQLNNTELKSDSDLLANNFNPLDRGRRGFEKVVIESNFSLPVWLAIVNRIWYDLRYTVKARLVMY